MADGYPFTAAPGQTDTSADAAPKDVGTLQRKARDRIRDAGPRGLTTNELAELLNIDRGSIQPRTSELRRLGHICDSGYRRCNANGKKAIVWVAAGGAQ